MLQYIPVQTSSQLDPHAEGARHQNAFSPSKQSSTVRVTSKHFPNDNHLNLALTARTIPWLRNYKVKVKGRPGLQIRDHSRKNALFPI